LKAIFLRVGVICSSDFGIRRIRTSGPVGGCIVGLINMAVASKFVHETALAETRPRANSPLWWSLSLVFVFMLLFEPILVATGTGVLSIVLVLSVFASFVYGRRFVVSNDFLILAFVLISSFTLIFGINQLVALARGGDLHLLQLLISAYFAYIPITYFVARTLGRTSDATGMALRMLAWACFLQSLFVILDWAVPAANSLLTSIVVQPEAVEISFRVAGLSSSTGDGLSFRQALGAMAALHLSVVSVMKMQRIWWVGVVCLCLLSMAFVGRTGVVLFLAFAIVYGFTSPLKKSVANSLFVFLAMYVVVGTIGVLLMSTAQREALFGIVLPQAFEFAFSYFAGEGFNVASLEVIMGRMLFVPESVDTLLLGDGYWSNPIGPGNYVPSDVGYVRSIYYVGVLGSLMVYIWYGFFWYVLRRMTSDSDIKSFIDGSFAALFLSHAKFPFLYSGTTLILCFLLFFVLYIDHQSRVLLMRRIHVL
jgi:hypothetical protein